MYFLYHVPLVASANGTIQVTPSTAIKSSTGTSVGSYKGSVAIDAKPYMVSAVDTQTNATNVMLSSTKQFTVTLSGPYAGAYGNSVGVEIVAGDLGTTGKASAAFGTGKLTITLNNNGGSPAYTVQDVLNAVNAVPGFTAAVSGTGVATTSLAATDTEATTITASSGGADSVKVTFSEPIKNSSVTTTDATTDWNFVNGTSATVTGSTAITSSAVLTVSLTASDKQIKTSVLNVKT